MKRSAGFIDEGTKVPNRLRRRVRFAKEPDKEIFGK